MLVVKVTYQYLFKWFFPYIINANTATAGRGISRDPPKIRLKHLNCITFFTIVNLTLFLVSRFIDVMSGTRAPDLSILV